MVVPSPIAYTSAFAYAYTVYPKPTPPLAFSRSSLIESADRDFDLVI